MANKKLKNAVDDSVKKTENLNEQKKPSKKTNKTITDKQISIDDLTITTNNNNNEDDAGESLSDNQKKKLAKVKQVKVELKKREKKKKRKNKKEEKKKEKLQKKQERIERHRNKTIKDQTKELDVDNYDNKSDTKKKRDPKPIALKKQTPTKDIKRLNTDPKIGLTQEQVDKQKALGLSNIVKKTNAKSYKSIFFGNIFTFFNLLGFLVAGALIAVRSYSNLYFLLVFLANIMIGIIQEIRAKKTIEKISLITAPSATLIRNKKQVVVPIEEVVLDDIIQFELGNQICADSIILNGAVEVNESLLTGESVPVKKKKGDMLYSGSFITSGKCIALVEKVGDENYSAKLAQKAKEYKKPKSELLRALRIIIASIGVIIIPLAVLTYMNNYNLAIVEFATKTEAIRASVARTAGSIIGMIPAGMFLLTSVALAVGVVKLARRKTLVQDLYSIEMLARSDVLCLDKTGTITDGTMKVKEVVNFTNPQNYTTKEIIPSMLSALEDNNMTSQALANSFGRTQHLSPDILLPFSSANKLSAVTFKEGTYILGAPEYVYKVRNKTIDDRVKKYAKNGYRVLMLAYSKEKIVGDKPPKNCFPVSLIAIEDHIREDAIKTIKWFNDNGVEIKIISGDNPITVSEVSRRVGISNADKFISLEGLSENEVIEAAQRYSVFGRVSPEQKSIIVKALKSKGRKVAMTGDGVNDILALKDADCSIAMASGSEAARNVSNLVLLDSNFSSLPSVVAEGRRVVNNISKSSSLFLMKTFMTIFVTIFCLITNMMYVFEPTQIILMETFVIGIPAFFLSLQSNKDKISGSFMTNLISKALPGALVLSINVIACYIFDYFVPTGNEVTTMASLVMLFSGLMILLKVCKPLDAYKGILYVCSILVALAALLLIPQQFFQYVEISLQSKFFIIILVMCSYHLYSFLIKTFDFLWDFQKNIIEITKQEAKGE